MIFAIHVQRIADEALQPDGFPFRPRFRAKQRFGDQELVNSRAGEQGIRRDGRPKARRNDLHNAFRRMVAVDVSQPSQPLDTQQDQRDDFVPPALFIEQARQQPFKTAPVGEAGQSIKLGGA